MQVPPAFRRCAADALCSHLPLLAAGRLCGTFSGMNSSDLWKRFQHYRCNLPAIDLSLDISRMTFAEGFFSEMAPAMAKAFEAMDALEKGDIANPDEKRMVGHYWLRAPKLAPSAEIASAIQKTIDSIKSFASDVHSARIRPVKTPKFTQVLSIGIGGSALGPMFVADALGDPQTDRMAMHFIDNTDPDGIDRVLRKIGSKLAETLCIVISKSGSTPEPRNGMIITSAAYESAGLDFS